jgi:hypothetical protein
MGRRRRTPLIAAIILTVTYNRLFAFRAVSGYLILKEFDQISAVWAGHFKNSVQTPFLGIIARTLPHALKLCVAGAVCGSEIEFNYTAAAPLYLSSTS